MSRTIGGILLILGITLLLIMYIAGKCLRKRYIEEIRLLKEDFKFKKKEKKKKKKEKAEMLELFTAVFLWLFDIFNYKNGSFLERRVEHKFIKLYAHNHKRYLRVYIASAMATASVILCVSFGGSGGYILSEYKNIDLEIRGNTIIKPSVGDGERCIPVDINLTEGDKEVKKHIELTVPESKYGEDKIKKMLEDELDQDFILNGNEGIEKITGKLNLIKSFRGFDSENFEIVWESSNMNILNSNGVVNQKALEDSFKDIDLGVKLVRKSDEEVLWRRDFPLKIIKDESAIKVDNMGTAVKVLNESLKGDSDSIDIPKEIEGVQIDWGIKKKKDISIYLIIGSILAACMLAFTAMEKKVMQNIKEKRDHILFEFPDFLNKLILLVNAGMNMKDAWIKIAGDTKRDNYFFRVVKETAYDMRETGVSELKAYENFRKKCSVNKVSKFVNIIRQNLRKGSSEMVYRLEELSKDCWQIRVDITKEMGKKASSKLLIPMMIMLIVIIIIVAMPAVIQISS